MRKLIPSQLRFRIFQLLYPTPRHLLKKQIQIDQNGLNLLEESVKQKYHTEWRSKSNYTKEAYEQDLKAHILERLMRARMRMIPWLDSVNRLDNAKILEIGCGTGSSVVALAEQGARVTAIDVDESALSVAKDRCKIYGLKVDLQLLNAVDLSNTFPDANFDLVTFSACLEHMTIDERLASLKNAWKILRTGGFLVVIGTPNRLWYFDNHTSMLPFFHWLPDKLAFKYSQFSPRENFRELYKDYDQESELHFLRRGRGISFHEFDIAIKPVTNMKVVSCLSAFNKIAFRLNSTKLERNYKSLLKSIYPKIHESFFDKNLDLIIKKD